MNNKQQQVSFQLNECKCNSFELTQFAIGNTTPINFANFQFQFEIELQIIPETKFVRFRITNELSAINEPYENIAKLIATFIFKILNFEQALTKNTDGNYGLPDALATTFLSVVLSTLRGMWTVKLEDTIYNNAVLPLIDASQMLPKRVPILG